MYICYLPPSPCRQAVPWHCQVRSYKKHLILDAVNYAGVWSTAITWEGHLLLILLKGTKLNKFRFLCVCVMLRIPAHILLWVCDASDAVLTSCLRLKLPFKGLRFCSCLPFDVSSHCKRRCIYTNVFVRPVQVCLYMFIYILWLFVCMMFCWCVYIAAPKRGRLFHLIEGQYLHEHSYRQLS